MTPSVGLGRVAHEADDDEIPATPDPA